MKTSISELNVYLVGGAVRDEHAKDLNLRKDSWSLKNSPVFSVYLILASLLLSFVFYQSFIVKTAAPKNEVVIAELVDLDTKMVQKNFGSTKHPEWKSVQQGFLVYKTPDGYLTLPNNHLQIVHPKIILYKN
jgi:hypothetical protein